MEWLAANAVQLFTAFILFCGGVAFAMNLDKRLINIEKEQNEIKNVIVVSARLEERINYISQTLIAQGKRLDWLSQRIYDKRQTQEENSST